MDYDVKFVIKKKSRSYNPEMLFIAQPDHLKWLADRPSFRWNSDFKSEHFIIILCKYTNIQVQDMPCIFFQRCSSTGVSYCAHLVCIHSLGLHSGKWRGATPPTTLKTRWYDCFSLQSNFNQLYLCMPLQITDNNTEYMYHNEIPCIF